MKRIAGIIIILLSLSSHASANYFADVYGTWADANEFKSQAGFGANLGMGVGNNFNLLFKYISTEAVVDEATPQEITYSQVFFLFGVEYLYPIKKSRFTWKSGIFAGRVEHDAEADIGGGGDEGIAIAITTGIQFDISQHIAAVTDVGYNYPYYTEGSLSDVDLHGFTVQIGFRFSLFDTRDLTTDY